MDEILKLVDGWKQHERWLNNNECPRKWFYYSVAVLCVSSADNFGRRVGSHLTFAVFTAHADHLNLLALGARQRLAVDVEANQVSVGTCAVVAFVNVLIAMLVFYSTLDTRFCKRVNTVSGHPRGVNQGRTYLDTSDSIRPQP